MVRYVPWLSPLPRVILGQGPARGHWRPTPSCLPAISKSCVIQLEIRCDNGWARFDTILVPGPAHTSVPTHVSSFSTALLFACSAPCVSLSLPLLSLAYRFPQLPLTAPASCSPLVLSWRTLRPVIGEETGQIGCPPAPPTVLIALLAPPAYRRGRARYRGLTRRRAAG